ncbi:MAG: FeoB-associated Cys-rich membrane protein [Spirochaetales bacterium]|nr:FeoB-associated Cys-rich membrane protein [Spirochaetales bacterium]
MTITDIAVALVIAGLIALAVRKIVKDKKNGSPCTGCPSCPQAGKCDGAHH